MIAKAGLGLVGLGAIGIGGVAFAKPEWLGINKEIPWAPLSQDKDFGGNSYSDTTFGSKHKNYLTGIKEKKEGNNNSWWQKSYEQWKKDHDDSTTRTNLGNKFNSNIAGPAKPKDANEGTDQYLKEICDTIYKAEAGKVKASTSSTDEYKEADVWKYCSPLGQKPTTVKNHDNKNTTNAIYKEEGGITPIGKTEEDSLISVNDEKNNKFWDIRNREFHGKDPFTTQVSINENSEKFFKQGQTDGKHIKDLCRDAYTKSSTSTTPSTTPSKEETKKYCSFGSIATA